MACQALTCPRAFECAGLLLKMLSPQLSIYGWSLLYLSPSAHVTSLEKPSLQTHLYSSFR